MLHKPDWPEARERLTALWNGRPLDRPCIGVTAPSGRTVQWPPPPDSVEQRWMDPAFNAGTALAQIGNTWWGGEAVPSYLLMCGWVNCLGGTPRFADETIWFEPMEFDFDAPPAFGFDPENPWVKRFHRAHLALAEAAGKDDFLVGQPCILPASDLLSMLMRAHNFLLALVDHPRWMREAIVQGARVQAEACKHCRGLIEGRHEFLYGIGGWMPFWAPEPFSATQADVSCMLSPAMYDEFILPELELCAREFGALWYHLDGGDARQHLPRLLSLPYLRVVQYTPAPCEPPNGPAHLEFYRTIQAAGKIVHVQLPKENVEPLARSLDPGLLMLSTSCDSIEEGQELLRSATRWACTRRDPNR